MNQTNATITLSPSRLDRQLPTLHARRGHSFAAALVGVPDDVYSVVMRVFRPDDTFVDIPCGRFPNGAALAYCIGTCFPSVGSAHYEIHAYDSKGNPTALGYGPVEIKDFSTSGTAITPGTSVTLDYIRDADGNLHTIKAVPDGNGGYTTIIDDAN